jgi:sulfoxide reductase catalytic subunit YedY
MPGITGLDFPAWLRALHYLNLLLISLLIRSGLEILSAHPKLYLRDDCPPGKELVRFTRTRAPQAGLWTSRDEEAAWSSWIALPGHENLGLGRHWHFLLDALWVATGIAYVVLLFVTPEWRRLIPTSWTIFPEAWQTLLVYLHGHIVYSPIYNPLQQLSYAAVVFLLSPLAILSGVALSPAISGRLPWYLKLFGGRQPARTIHFLCMTLFVAFTVVHTLMVFLHGLPREWGAIVLGQTINPNLPLALVVGALGLVVVVIANVVATGASLRRRRQTQVALQFFTDPLRRWIFHHTTSHEHYTRADISSYFWANGRPPAETEYLDLARNGFRGWTLPVYGLVECPLQLSLDDLRAMPKEMQITKHCCIQGWSGVAEWGGVPVRHIMELCRPRETARYVVFYAFDNKSTSEPRPAGPGYFYGTLDIELAQHPQTILAYEMNGEPLPVPHGAPVRLRVENPVGLQDGQVHPGDRICGRLPEDRAGHGRLARGSPVLQHGGRNLTGQLSRGA